MVISSFKLTPMVIWWNLCGYWVLGRRELPAGGQDSCGSLPQFQIQNTKAVLKVRFSDDF